MSGIMKSATIVLTSALFLLNAACTTITPVYGDEPADYVGQLEAGDRVRLTYLNNRAAEIRVTEINETGVRGTLHKNTPLRPKGAEVFAEWPDIYTVETVKVSALKTAGAGVGIIVAIPILVVGALLAACTQSNCS